MGQNRKIRIEYTTAPDFKKIPITGAWGGPMPTGDSILCNMYCDILTTPPAFEQDIPENGVVEVQQTGDPSADVLLIREAQIGIVLTPRAAKAIAEWLLNQIRIFEQKESDKL